MKGASSMPDTLHSQDIHLEQDIAHQRREWKVERFGWAVMALVILLAFLGLFGGGGIFTTERKPIAGETDVFLEYPRFLRDQSNSVLRIHFSPVKGAAALSQVWLDEDYVREFQLEQITPRPERVEAMDNKLIFHFAGQPRTVSFYLRADTMGSVHGNAGTGPGMNATPFSQFLYP